jgi:PAS domain S-box-containing protein
VEIATRGVWVGQPVERILEGQLADLQSSLIGKHHFADVTRVSADLSRTMAAGNYLLPGQRRTSAQRELGVILLAFDDREARAALDHATRMAFGRACALTFTLAMLAFLLLQRRVLLPLEAMARTLALRAKDDDAARVPADLCANDEIGQVAHSLNLSFDDIERLNRMRDQREDDIAEIMLAMKRVDERLAFLLSGISAMVYAGRPDGMHISFVSGNAQRVTGFSPQDFMADPELWAQRLHPHDAPEVLASLRSRLVGSNLSLEYRFRHREGHYIWLHDDSRLMAVQDNRPAETIGFMLDVSARKQTERQLLESEMKFSALIEALPQWAWIARVDGPVEIIGRKATAYFGLPPEKLRNDEWRDFIHPEDRAHAFQLFRTARDSGEPFSVDLRLRRADGIYRWFNATGAPMRDDNGQIIRWVGSNIDITERRSAEEQLRESQKMEAIGQLTGGLAHDFNNLLGVVVGNLDMLADELPADDERARRHHQTALDAALRGAEVTMSLLAVARRQPLEVGNHDVVTLIEEMLPLLRASAGSGVQILTQLPAGRMVARLDARGLSNVILNLVINARDAMEDQPGEKRIILRLRKTVVKPESALGLAPASYVVLEITDTGPGMSAQVRAQAFEPFFTTKARDKGTGLGLAMVHGYAEQLGGTARIDSIEGQGTTVRVYLPLDPINDAQEEQDEQKRLAALRSLRVLDTPSEAAFDALVLEAAHVCGTAIAVISLVDEHRQWFKSRLGLQVDETPREDAFCAHAIRNPGEIMIVSDAAADPRFAANPLVLDEPKIRFYAGVPLVDERGRAMGTLCVIDRVPLSLNDMQKDALQELADEISLMMRLKAPARDRPVRETALDSTLPLSTDPTTQRVQVLVVDDEPGMCDLACGWLRALDYDPVPALGADEALRELRTRAFDVLFTDVVMPGSMDGVSLSRQARRLQPRLKILFSSGYARNMAAEIEQIGPLLSKPYRKHHLAEALKKLLEKDSQPA